MTQIHDWPPEGGSVRRPGTYAKLTSRTYKQNFQTELPNDHNIAEMPRHEVLSNREKLILLGIIEDRQEAGESLRSCCCNLMLQPSQVRRWQQARQDMSNPMPVSSCSRGGAVIEMVFLTSRTRFHGVGTIVDSEGIAKSVQLFKERRREQKILPCGASAIRIKSCSGR